MDKLEKSIEDKTRKLIKRKVMMTHNRRINHQLNVLNKPLLSCNCNKTLNEKIKLTGIYRDGYCKTEKMILGYIQFVQ